MRRIADSPLRTSLLFTGLTFLQPAINVLLLPLYLTCLSPSEYGVYALMTNISVMAHHLAALRIQDAMGPLYFRFDGNPESQHRFLVTLLQATLAMNVVFFSVAILAGPWLFLHLFNDSEIASFYPLGLLAVFIGILSSISGPFLVYLKNARAIGRFASLYTGMVVVNVGAQLLLIVVMERGAQGALEARLAGPALLALMTIFLNFRFLLRPPDWEQLKKALRFSVPMVPFALITWSATFADRLLVEQAFDLSTLGTYSLLLTLVTLITMASTAAYNGIQPFLFEELSHREQRRPERLRRLARTYFAIPFIAGGLIAALSPALPLITDKEAYSAVTNYMTLGIVVFFLESIAILLRGLLVHALKPAAISASSAIAVGFQFVAYLLLIPLFGIRGALFGTLAAQIILIALFVFLLHLKSGETRVPIMGMISLPILLILLFVLPELLFQLGTIHPILKIFFQFSSTSLPFLWYFLAKKERFVWNSGGKGTI